MQTLIADDAELPPGATASEHISRHIRLLLDWRGEVLAEIRTLIREADPSVVETWKWSGTPVWEHAGIICTGEVYRNAVRVTFPKGAALEDPEGLFNGSLTSDQRRAIDLGEASLLNAEAFTGLVKAAISLNTGR